MAIALRSSIGSNNGGGGTSITMTVPSPVVNGDVLIMVIHARGGTGTTINTPSGWTLLNRTNSGTTLAQGIYWRQASSEPASYSVSITSNKASGVMVALSGASGASPAAAQYGAQANASSATVTAPALGSWTASDGMDVFLGGTATGTTFTTAPTNYTLDVTVASTGGSVSTRTTSGDAWRILTAVTTVGSISGTMGAAAVNIGAHVFIKAAGTFTQALSASLTPSGTIARLTGHTMTAALTPAGTLTRRTVHILTAALTPAGVLVRLTSRAFTASLTPSGVLASSKLFVKALTASLTPAGALTKATLKSMAASLMPSGAVSRLTSKAMTAGLTPAGVLVRLTARAFAASLTPAGAIARLTTKGLSAGLTPAGALAKLTSRTFSATFTPSGSLARLTAKVLAGGLTLAGAIATVAQIFISGLGRAPIAEAIVSLVRAVIRAPVPSAAAETPVPKGDAS